MGRALEATFYDEPEATWFISDNPMSVFNWVARARFAKDMPDSRIDEVFKRISESESEAAMYWVMGPVAINPHLSNLMQAAGWQKNTLPAMAADLTKLSERSTDPAGFTIEHVNNGEALQQWIRVFTAGYGLPDSAGNYTIDLLNKRGYVNHPAAHFYLSRLSGLTTGQNMQIVDDGAPTQIKEVFTQSTIACASSLPLTNMGKGVFNGYPFTQLISSFWRLLA